MRLVYLALGWTAGIVLAANNASPSPGVLLAWGALLALSVWLCWYDRRWWTVALIAFTLGGLRMSLVPRSSDLAAFNNSGGLSITGRVVAEPDRRDTETQIQVEAETLNSCRNDHADQWPGPGAGPAPVGGPHR